MGSIADRLLIDLADGTAPSCKPDAPSWRVISYTNQSPIGEALVARAGRVLAEAEGFVAMARGTDITLLGDFLAGHLPAGVRPIRSKSHREQN